ncbi:MAG: iron chelate uptake ABC transporter family permease subunit [Gaiella sp.]
MIVGFLLDDYTLRTVALGAVALGIVSGALGTFAVLRRQALVGDAVSHVALPGVVLAYVVAGTTGSLWQMVGAALTGFASVLLVGAVVRTTRVKSDAALGIWLSVFFGVGLVLLTWIQGRPDASQAGLDRFLFGQAATVLRDDVRTIVVIGGAALVVVALLWKQLKLLAFDPDYGVTLGLPMRAVEIVLTGLLVVAIVIGLQMVGAVLMSAMIVAPPAAARQWTHRLGTMVLVAAAVGAVAGATGALVSAEVDRLPTGPTIVLVATLLVVGSLLFGPRGLVVAGVRARRARAGLGDHVVLADLLALERLHGGPHPHETATVTALVEADATGALGSLERRGLVRRDPEGRWALTERGREVARR